MTLARAAEFGAFANPRFANGKGWTLNTPRRLLLELWAILVLAALVGFLGPFGTYTQAPLASRIWRWLSLLAGAYVLIRPAIALLRRLAKAIGLPEGPVTFWGVWLCSAPLAAIWLWIGQDEFRQLDGFVGLMPFSILCSVAVLAVARWAASADLRIVGRSGVHDEKTIADEAVEPALSESDRMVEATQGEEPSPAALMNRLSPAFAGPVVALQSEDHYVRVHGAMGSELLLMRLRDAIAEMGSVPGEQVHRSWWVAASGIVDVDVAGRNWTIHLTGGQSVPIARDSIPRLKRSGLLEGKSR